VHSPMGGQGMNTGLQDAYNLAWKLDLAVAQRAGDTLLDSYETERMGVAQRLLSSTDRAFRYLVSDRWLAGIFRTHVVMRIVATAMKLQRARRLAFRTLSQIGISYRSSVLSRTLAGVPADAPRAGDRFPWIRLCFDRGSPSEDLFAKLDDVPFNLLVFGQAGRAPARLGGGEDHVRVYDIPTDGVNGAELARVGIPRKSYFLLRPDGHIGLAGIDVDAAEVRRWFDAAGIRSA